jgi:hypothetical protein
MNASKSPDFTPNDIVTGILYFWARSHPNESIAENKIYERFHELAVKHPDIFKEFYFKSSGKYWLSNELEDILSGCFIWGILESDAPHHYNKIRVRAPAADAGLKLLSNKYSSKLNKLEFLAKEFGS